VAFLNSLINNPHDFYKDVKNVKGVKSRMTSSLNGKHNAKDIADEFAKEYKALYNTHPFDRHNYNMIQAEISPLISNVNINNVTVNAEQVRKAVKHIKKSKSDGTCNITSDNFINGTEKLFSHLSNLFTLCIVHGYIPIVLLLSTIIPIPKDRLGDITDLNNYRGIALCAMCLKIFEYTVLDSHGSDLMSGDHQFAYKENASTTQCTWIAREVISYYNTNGSHVYACLLDCSKAFDKIKYDILFHKLIKRGLSPVIIRMLLYSYTHSQVRVKWNGEMSDSFGVTNGVRQGAVLSPFLFNIYMEELISSIKHEGKGCYVGSDYYGVLVYADDILLLSPSLKALQCMLNKCAEFGTKTGLQFNCKKTICIDFHGADRCNKMDYKVYLYDQMLKWNNNVKHLGHTLTCCLRCDKDINIKKGQFIACTNNIVTEFAFAHPNVKSKLLSMYGTSFYGAALWDLYGNASNKLYTTWNIAIRRIFNLPYKTHRRFLDIISGLRHINVSLKLRFINFVNSLIDSENTLISNLLRYSITSNLSLTGLTLNRILREFNICSLQQFEYHRNTAWKLMCDTYYKTRILCEIDMYHCSIINEMINCLHGISDCGLQPNECIYIINDLATN
jgi:hypothetical protein